MAIHLADPLLQSDAGGADLFVGYQPTGRAAASLGELGGFPEVEAIEVPVESLLGLGARVPAGECQGRGRQAQARSQGCEQGDAAMAMQAAQRLISSIFWMGARARSRMVSSRSIAGAMVSRQRHTFSRVLSRM